MSFEAEHLKMPLLECGEKDSKRATLLHFSLIQKISSTTDTDPHSLPGSPQVGLLLHNHMYIIMILHISYKLRNELYRPTSFTLRSHNFCAFALSLTSWDGSFT